MTGRRLGSKDGETCQKVLEIMIREADMDGLVIFPESLTALELGISQASVNFHIQTLIKDRKLTRLDAFHSRGPTGGKLVQYQLSDDLF